MSIHYFSLIVFDFFILSATSACYGHDIWCLGGSIYLLDGIRASKVCHWLAAHTNKFPWVFFIAGPLCGGFVIQGQNISDVVNPLNVDLLL